MADYVFIVEMIHIITWKILQPIDCLMYDCGSPSVFSIINEIYFRLIVINTGSNAGD